MSGAALAVRDLHVRIATRRGVAHVVNGLSYEVHPGETLALVGESGSGKSVGALGLMGLLPSPPARITGQALLDGEDLVAADAERRRELRGGRISMVFQDPSSSLNPVLTVGRQITEAVQAHLDCDDDAAEDRAAELLDAVGIPAPAARLRAYPHQLSGGMRQRVMIAIALAADPAVLIADEPTTALDVTIQAQIVELVARLQRERDMAVLWITHDLGVVAGLADRVVVLYAGQTVETADVDTLFADPRHPYTRGLLGSLPVLGEERGELATIPGLPPSPTDLPPGCAFHPRCAYRLDARCEREVPPLREVGAGHEVRCFYDAGHEGPA